MKINYIFSLMNSFNKTEISFITMQAIFPDDFHLLSDYYFLKKTSLHLLLQHFRACVSLSGTTCMATQLALWQCPPFPTVPQFHSGQRQVHLLTCHLWWNIGKYAINVWCVWLKSYKFFYNSWLWMEMKILYKKPPKILLKNEGLFGW